MKWQVLYEREGGGAWGQGREGKGRRREIGTREEETVSVGFVNTYLSEDTRYIH